MTYYRKYQENSVVDPDPIRIQRCPWIRIRIRNPDPRGQKLPTKIETVNKFHFFKHWCSLLRTKGFSCSLDVLYGGLGISNCNF